MKLSEILRGRVLGIFVYLLLAGVREELSAFIGSGCANSVFFGMEKKPFILDLYNQMCDI